MVPVFLCDVRVDAKQSGEEDEVPPSNETKRETKKLT